MSAYNKMMFVDDEGYGNEEVERRARELGAFEYLEYLNEPISPDTLAAVVTAAMPLKLDIAPKAVVAEASEAEAAAAVEAEAALAPEVVRKSRLRVALEILVVAPLLGGAFVMFLPIIGLGALIWMSGTGLFNSAGQRRHSAGYGRS